MRQIQGLAASRGIALGPAWRLDPPLPACPRRNVEDPAAEWERAQAVLEVARQQLAELVARARELAGEEHAAIFQAQALMLEDPALLEAARAAIEIGRLNAEAALLDAAEAQAQQLEALEDEYLRARAADVRDVAQRLLRILTGCTEPNLACGEAPVVLVATDLSPSELITLDRRKLLGVCTAEGGPTSHTAILARGLGLPAVVGAGPAVLEISDATPVVLDGSAGLLIVEPDAETLAAYRERRAMAARLAGQARVRAHAPAIDRDGQCVPVLANVGDLASAQAALEAGADGAGLVRTEFLYLGRSSLPSEEEQFTAYRALADLFGTLPVVLRTLDIGADKRLAGLDQPLEPNPALGLRGIRLALARPALLKTQLRAALRAWAGRSLRVMFPLVATIGEVRAARAILEACRTEMEAGGVALPERVEVGIMVETPAAALLAGRLAREVDFMSIGTNDLAQYTAAADRGLASVAALASGLHPAVLRLIQWTIEAAHVAGRRVGLCGELGAQPLAIPVLVGLGLDELSVNPPAVPLVKELIRALSRREAEALAREALEEEGAEAVERLVRARVPAAVDLL